MNILLQKLTLCACVVVVSVFADQIPLSLSSAGTIGGTSVFMADLTGIMDLTQIGSISIVDDGTTYGGADGIFSGFDLDMMFLDGDGDLATVGDRIYATDLIFQAGTTRPTPLTSMHPNAAHRGPVFGSVDATTIDESTATLNSIDGIAVADVDIADGFLTLGDGGVLSANFDPAVMIGPSLHLVVGEVGGQQGEFLNASVYVSPTPVPEPPTLSLLFLGLGLIGTLSFRRSKQ